MQQIDKWRILNVVGPGARITADIFLVVHKQGNNFAVHVTSFVSNWVYLI
jgi:hypothetical protein